MDLFTYLMAKNNQNTHKDLFSYLLGKGSGGGGTYTTFTGTSLNIASTLRAKIKNFMLNSTQLTQDGTPTPENPVDVNVIKGDNNIKIQNQNLLSLPTDATVLGITSTQNSDGSFTLNGTAASAPNYKEFPLDRHVTLEAGTYYFTIINNKLSSNNNININLYTGNSNVFDRDFTTIGEHKITVTLTETKTIKSFRTYITTGTSYDNVNIKLMISKTSDSIFVEHQEQNYPISLGNLEYCKIGDYKDQFFKNTTDSEFYDNTLIENEWYLKKKVSKIDSYNGETITTPYISTTGGLDTGATVYYGLTTPQYIHISETDYPTLKTELDNLYNNVKSYNGQTNITQTNDDLPFNISVDVKVANL